MKEIIQIEEWQAERMIALLYSVSLPHKMQILKDKGYIKKSALEDFKEYAATLDLDARVIDGYYVEQLYRKAIKAIEEIENKRK